MKKYVILSVVFFAAFIWATLYYFNPKNVIKREVKSIVAQGDSSIIVNFLSGKYPQLKEYADTAAFRVRNKITVKNMGSFLPIKAYQTMAAISGVKYAASRVYYESTSTYKVRDESELRDWDLGIEKLEQRLPEALRMELRKIVLKEEQDFLWLTKYYNKAKMEELCLKNLKSAKPFPSEFYLGMTSDTALVARVVKKLSDKEVLEHRLSGKVSRKRQWKLVESMSLDASICYFRGWNMPSADFERMLNVKKYNNKDLFLYYRIGLVSKDYLCKRLEEMFSTKFLYLNFRNFNDHDVNHKVFEVLIKSVQCRSDYVLADEFFQEQNEPDWAEVLALKKGYLLK